MLELSPLKKTYYTKDQLALLDLQKVPQHIAIIMDGNRRWAIKNHISIMEGHSKGADTAVDTLKAGKELGVKVMTLYTFSTENWNRTKEEVCSLMWLYETYIKKLIPEMIEENIRFQTIGEIEELPLSLQEVVQEAKAATAKGRAMEAVFAMNYGSKDELIRAMKKIYLEIEKGNLNSSAINEQMLTSFLDTAYLPDPDLFIRTSGEKRISNFLLLQLAYTELYVTQTLWPDFKASDLFHAVFDYQQRKRRFGT